MRQLSGPLIPVTPGSNGWLYYSFSLDRPCLSEADRARFVDAVTRAERVVAATGRSLLVAIAPDKATIVPDFLPDVATCVAEVADAVSTLEGVDSLVTVWAEMRTAGARHDNRGSVQDPARRLAACGCFRVRQVQMRVSGNDGVQAVQGGQRPDRVFLSGAFLPLSQSGMREGHNHVALLALQIGDGLPRGLGHVIERYVSGQMIRIPDQGLWRQHGKNPDSQGDPPDLTRDHRPGQNRQTAPVCPARVRAQHWHRCVPQAFAQLRQTKVEIVIAKTRGVIPHQTQSLIKDVRTLQPFHRGFVQRRSLKPVAIVDSHDGDPLRSGLCPQVADASCDPRHTQTTGWTISVIIKAAHLHVQISGRQNAQLSL